MRGCRKRWTQRILWGSPNGYGFEATCDRHRRVFDARLTVCSRYFHQRFDPTPSWSRSTTTTELSTTVSRPSTERSDTGPRFQPLGAVASRAAGLALLCPLVQSPGSARCLEVDQFRQRCGVSGLRQINDHLLEPLLPKSAGQDLSIALIDATDLEAACSGHKKREPERIPPSEPHWEDER